MLTEATKEAFHTRFIRAMEGHPRCPVQVHGRLTWFRDLLEAETGEGVSLQTVQKWSTGASVPRPPKIAKMAQALGVDDIWLAMGRSQPQTDQSKLRRARAASGSLLVVAGLAELSGGHVAFPDKQEGAANSIFVTLDGTLRQINVVVADIVNGKVRADVPSGVSGVVLGIEQSQENPFCVRLFDLTDAEVSPEGLAVADLKDVQEVTTIASLFSA